MGLPPSLVHAAHFTYMEVEDVASTESDTMVGADGANVCVMAGKYMMGKLDQVFVNG